MAAGLRRPSRTQGGGPRRRRAGRHRHCGGVARLRGRCNGVDDGSGGPSGDAWPLHLWRGARLAIRSGACESEPRLDDRAPAAEGAERPMPKTCMII